PCFFLLLRPLHRSSPNLFPYTKLFRSAFTVTNILDRGTVSVSPNWKWENHEGNVVKIVGFSSTVSSPGLDSFAIGKLETLILNRSEEHTSELQSRENLVCRLLLEKKNI